MKILMARHGQSQWQVEGDVVGGDSPLTDTGRWQAHRLGEHLRTYERVDAVVSSSMRRAQETAEIVASYLERPVGVDVALREYDEWGAGWAPLPLSQWDAQPSGEISGGFLRFRKRVSGALRRFVETHSDAQTLLIVAHGGTLGVILRYLLGSDTPRLYLWNTALSAVEWRLDKERGSWRFLYLNNMEHLPRFLRTV